MTQNECVYAICCRPEVDNDVISSRNLMTIEGYVPVNFAAVTSNSFRYIRKSHFVAAEAAAPDIDGSIKRQRFHVFA